MGQCLVLLSPMFLCVLMTPALHFPDLVVQYLSNEVWRGVLFVGLNTSIVLSMIRSYHLGVRLKR